MADKTDNTLADSNCDNSVIAACKRKIKFIEDSDCHISNQNNEHISRYIRVMENDYSLQRNPFEFVEKSGPQHLLPVGSKPIDYFNIFFTDSLWAMMVKETNKYAEELLSKSMANAKSRLIDWYPITSLEMKAFVAVLLEMDITRKPTIYSYWDVGSRAIPWFKKMFSWKRFQNLLRCFHIVDNKKCFPPGHKKYDACAKFNPILKHANQVFQKHYTPHKMLSIDEFLVRTLCHSSNTQYLPKKKHHKWGIKFWMLCDAISKYCISFYCYRGAKSKITRNGLGYNVVEKLLQHADRLNKGHHIYIDKFFTSTVLAKYLFAKNTYMTGTIRRNSKDIPNEAKQIKGAETKYFINGEVLLCAHREKATSRNPLLLISTDASTRNVAMIKKHCGKEKEKAKPSIVTSYNNLIGGVDGSDKMLYTFVDERRTLQYWKKVIFNIFSRMALNSYLLYKESEGKQAVSRLQYTSNLISEIEYEWTRTKEDECTMEEKKPYRLEKLPGRNLRRCVVCSTKGNIRRSNLICAVCKKGLHPLCFHSHDCKLLESGKRLALFPSSASEEVEDLNNMSTQFDVEKLIVSVRSRPQLWNKSEPGYGDKVLAEKLWEEIAEEDFKGLINKHKLKTRWHSLKDVLRRELKMVVQKPDHKKKLWPYYKQMLFLTPHVGFRSEGGVEYLSSSVKIEEDSNEGMFLEHPETNFSERNEDNEPENGAENQPVIQATYQDPQFDSFERNQYNEDDYHFAMSIIPYMKQVPMHKKLKMRIAISEAILKETELS